MTGPRKKTGFYDVYRPSPSVYPISDEEWECWFVELANQLDTDPALFNAWWYAKVRSDVLAELVPPQPLKGGRRTERFVRKKGLQPTDRKPLVAQSIGDFGGMFFGTDYGYHRELDSAPRARKGQEAGIFVVAISLARQEWEDARTFSCGSKQIENWTYRDILACTYALVEEAERRRDRVSLFIATREWEEKWDEFWFDRRQRENPDRKMVSRLWDRSGKVRMTHSYNPFLRGWNWGWRHPTRTVWEAVGGKYDWEQLSRGQKLDWRKRILERRFDHQESIYDDLVNVTINKNYEMFETGEMSPPVALNSTDYGKLKDFLLRMPNLPHPGIASSPPRFLQHIADYWEYFQSEKRGTVIYIMNMQSYIFQTWKILELMKSFADVWVFDLSDREQFFRTYGYQPEDMLFSKEAAIDCGLERLDSRGRPTGVPLFVNAGERLFNYVHIDDPGRLSYYVLRAMRGGLSTSTGGIRFYETSVRHGSGGPNWNCSICGRPITFTLAQVGVPNDVYKAEGGYYTDGNTYWHPNCGGGINSGFW